MSRLILAIDTCGATGAIALARVDDVALAQVGDDALVLVAQAQLPGRTYGSSLISRIAELLDEVAAKLDQVAAICVVNGPGSFTGVRIGVATAKALAEAGGTPLIAISRLAVLCAIAEVVEPCCGLLDAGRGEFYGGVYRGTACLREQLMTIEDVAAAGAEMTIIAAEAAVEVAVGDAFPNVKLVSVRMPSVIDALPLAAARFRSGSFDDHAALDGNYLRRTDAEIFAKPQPRALGNVAR